MNKNIWFQLLKVLFVLVLLISISSLNALTAQAGPAARMANAATNSLTTLQFASTDINSVAVYEVGNKVFVGDAANNAVIVLDGTTNQVITTIAGVPGGGGGGMIVDETYGKVYFYTNTNTGVLSATTYQVLSTSLPKGFLVHDEINDKLYIVNGNASNYTVTRLNIADDSSALIYSGSGNFSGAKINTATNELAVLIYYPARIDFINVNTLAVGSFDIAATEGNHALDFEMNIIENKYYASLITIPGQGQMGIFIFDRDTNAYSFVGQDDLEPLVFNPNSNTLFSGGQVGTSMAVINGATDEFTAIDVNSNSNTGHGAGAVRYATDHAYFTSQDQIALVDKFKTVDFVSLPIAPRGGAIGNDIDINQSTGKVYIIADNESGKVFVIQDAPSDGVGNLAQDGGFENGTPNPFWMEYSGLGYNDLLICDATNCGGAGAHTGNFWAKLGGWASEKHLSQTGVLPANLTMLNFWLQIPFAGTWASSDTLTVKIDGTPVWALAGNASGYSAYKKVSLDVSAYANGATHKITFDSFVFTGSNPGSIFYVDDVTFEAPPTVTPTPTITLTPTITSTPTITLTPTLTLTSTRTPTVPVSPTPTVTQTPTSTVTPTSSPTPSPIATATCNPQDFRILLAGADANAVTLRTQLLADPDVSVVDNFDLRYGTPTLAQLQQYDIVVAWTNEAPSNRITLGDRLAAYQDSGGVVVVMYSAFSSAFIFRIDGTWLTGGYSPYSYAGGYASTDVTLGSYQAAHPLMQGVTVLYATSREANLIAAGATEVAAYSDGSSAIAVKTTNGRTAVGITAYIGEGGTWSGNYARVIANAGRWLAGPRCAATATATPSKTPTRTPTAVRVNTSFLSVAPQDGWILESSETSNVGGTINASATTFNLGDNASKKQYRSILSFNTSSLPDTAVITAVTLKVKKQGIIGGGNPLSIFQGFMIDMKTGLFGTAALQATDFQAIASKTYGPFSPALVSNIYSISLTTGKAYINKLATNGGLTQIRLRFKLDDNNDAAANYLSLYSGNAATAADRPQLMITYYVP